MGEYSRHKLIILLSLAMPVGIVLSYATWTTSPAQEQAPIELKSATSTEIIQATFKMNVVPAQTDLSQYIEITSGCGPYFDGDPCINMRSGPGIDYPVVLRLRKGVVLKVAGTVTENGQTWYKIGFDGVIHYPERITSDWYVAADYVRLFTDEGKIETMNGINASSTKRIVVRLTNEMLYAYDGDTLFMQQSISTGLKSTPTPTGTFWVLRKNPDSYMQGPIPDFSDQYYDLPGVPWDLYFIEDGTVIHGAYWHDHFGEPWSHGCVNLPPDQAKKLYEWAELGTPVIVEN